MHPDTALVLYVILGIVCLGFAGLVVGMFASVTRENGVWRP